MNIKIAIQQVLSVCTPSKIVLFGSQAKGTATEKSDIDLCIVTETNNKRLLLTKLYCAVETDLPVDIVLYTPTEWDKHAAIRGSFANKISAEGALLYGR